MTFCKSKFSKNHCLKLYLCKRKVFGDAFIQARRFHYEEKYLFLSCFLHNSNFIILVLLFILFYRVYKIDLIIPKSFIKGIQSALLTDNTKVWTLLHKQKFKWKIWFWEHFWHEARALAGLDILKERSSFKICCTLWSVQLTRE